MGHLKVVILAAGAGTRLGNSCQKCLTTLADSRTILEHQLAILYDYVRPDDVLVVVGYKKECIMEAFPMLGFAYNERFNVTNTAKSLLRGLRKVRDNNVIWLNGDVVFERKVVERLVVEDHRCLYRRQNALVLFHKRRMLLYAS